ncbi:sensor domain-containing protein [Prauserella muralis]|uniref:Two-component system sensor kinase n=1 Tax=Prauserella muralis TaxID=588067 RepID=A0A2V4BDI9_9PSEU|nr:sensor domain-containing protein [Prauserella muralis]PXY32572.1 two-component system sensor kinase [Prauserella muralis]TWE23713.1 putative sensor protein [Prauserella muralis]
MTAAPSGADLDRTRPGFGGALAYLLLNLPVGIAGFVFLVTLGSVGISTAVIWVGVPVAALAVLTARGAARLERARVYALLDSHIPLPYRSLPEGGQRARWMARLRDAATWRDITYFLLLFPIGVAQFVVVVTAWSVSLGLAGLPLFYRYLPEGAYFFPSYDLRWITVDSELSALPWSALGVLFIAVSVALTRGLAAGHVRFARALLGPTAKRVRESEGSLTWTSPMSPVAG